MCGVSAFLRASVCTTAWASCPLPACLPLRRYDFSHPIGRFATPEDAFATHAWQVLSGAEHTSRVTRRESYMKLDFRSLAY
eukprot:919482-Pleurochrysis_carterae.AAC.1